jgi:hypothetical protein
MSWLGDWTIGETRDFFFTTRRFSTGAPFTLAGTPAISAYEDNSTTEITAGITLTTDFDSRTGLNHVRVVASGGNGFEAGKSYAFVITAGTVDSVSVVGEVVGSCTIERAAAHTRLGAPAGASVSADIAGVQSDTDNIQTRLPAALVSGRIDASVGAVATGAIDAAAIAANAIGASELAADAVAEIADAVWDEARSGHVTAGTFGEGVASVQGNVTGSVASVTGAVGSVTGSVGSVTAAVTVGTNNDKTGYRLSAAGVDDILDDPLTEPAATFTWAGATLRTVIAWLGAMGRNRRTQTATTATLRNDANSADISTSALSDDGTTAVRGEWT